MEWYVILIWALFWGIITMLVGKSKGINGFFYGFALGFLGLIIVLCMKGKDTQYTNINKVNVDNSNHNDKYSNLERLYELKQNGTLTEEEYENEKNKVMNS